jgi:hypothetical protein
MSVTQHNMTTPVVDLDLTLRNVGRSPELVAYARRLCERTERALGKKLRWNVTAVRQNRRKNVCVEVSAGDDDVFGVGVDQDEFLAMRNAFAFFEAPVRSSYAPPPPTMP